MNTIQNQTQYSLNGKVALVTGGGTGIGLGTAQRLIEAGAFVYITGRRQNILDDAIKILGENAKGIQADVTLKADADKVADIIRKEKGSLDIVFGNAGIGERSPLEKITEESIDRMYATNVKGNIFIVQAVLPFLNNGGSIILNSSATVRMGLENLTLYAGTKAALQAMAKVWAAELRERKIRVNTISPGLVPTDIYKNSSATMTPEQLQAFAKGVSQEIPAGRPGTPQEIGDLVVFLASPAGAFINATDITIDGGHSGVYAGDLK